MTSHKLALYSLVFAIGTTGPTRYLCDEIVQSKLLLNLRIASDQLWTVATSHHIPRA